MHPEESPPKVDDSPRLNGWLVLAGALHLVAMLFLMSALVSLGPLTLTFSIAGGGLLLVAACGLYVATVAYDLRKRRIL